MRGLNQIGDPALVIPMPSGNSLKPGKLFNKAKRADVLNTTRRQTNRLMKHGGKEGRKEGKSESKKESESSHVGKKALIIIGRIIRE